MVLAFKNLRLKSLAARLSNSSILRFLSSSVPQFLSSSFLKPSRIHQICIRDPFHRILELLGAEGFHLAGGHSGVDMPGFAAGIFQHNGAGGDQAVLFHHGVIHDDGAHADEHIIFQGATVYDGAVADGNVIPDNGGGALIGAVDDRTILDIDLVADPDAVHVAADDALEPEAAVVSGDDVAYDGGVLGKVAVVPELRLNAFDWFD